MLQEQTGLQRRTKVADVHHPPMEEGVEFPGPVLALQYRAHGPALGLALKLWKVGKLGRRPVKKKKVEA